MNVWIRPPFELVIRGGLIVDGSGGEPFGADVAVRDGLIAAVEPLPDDSGERELNAAGLIVAPGFINCHSHSDETILEHPEAESIVAQGVTTEVICNCGFGPKHFPDACAFRRELEASGTSVNLALLAPHGTVKETTGEDVAALCAALDGCLDAGCLGVSLGLEYDPGARASREELLAVARRVATRDAMLTVHLRNEDDQLLEAVEEMLDVARRSGARLQISHLKSCGKHNWGKAFDALQVIERARTEGVSIGYDRYPYTAVMTSLQRLLPPEAWWQSDEQRNQRLRAGEYKAHLLKRIIESGGPESIVLARFPFDPSLAGHSLGTVAKHLRKPAVEAAEWVLLHAGRDGDMTVHSLDEGETIAVLARADCMVCTDAAGRPLTAQNGLHPHPRAFGSMPRFLGHYVRERGITTLPAAIRQLTGLPAETFGFRDRGHIAPGKAADLVVFDFATIADTATFERPWSGPVGIAAVFVNGVQVMSRGAHSDARPGVVL